MREGRESPEYEQQDATELAEAALGTRLTPGEVSSYWTRKAIDFIRAQPLSWLALSGRKAMLLASRTEVVDTESQESYEEWSTLLEVLAPIGHFGVLVPLAVLGMLAAGDRQGRLALYYGLMSTYAASVLLFYVSARYRLPLVPFLILFAAAGIASLPSAARAATARRRTVAVLLVGAAVVVTNRRVLSNDLQRAMTETNLGAALQSNERFAEAEGQYRRAIAIQPAYAPAYVNLGTVLVLQNRLDEAINAFTRARELGSNDPELPGRLAYVLVRAGRNEEAITAHRDAIARNPNSAAAIRIRDAVARSATVPGRDRAIQGRSRAVSRVGRSPQQPRDGPGAVGQSSRGDSPIRGSDPPQPEFDGRAPQPRDCQKEKY